MIHMNLWQNAVTVLIVVFAGGLIVGKLTEKPRIPDVAAYLVYGILIGPAVLNWISQPSQSQVNQLLLNVGATLILFDGGRGVQFQVLRKVWLSIVLLATVGVVITAFTMGLAAHYLLGVPWIVAILLGSVIASTDPATLIPVFKRVPIVPKLQQTVESESAFNDATGAVLVFTVLSLLGAGGHVDWLTPVWSFVHSAVIGLVLGGLLGLLSVWLVSMKGWGIFHEYGSIVMLITALSSFQLANMLNASGFMAAFTAGMVTGNGQVFRMGFAEHTEENIHHFGSAMTLIMRMLIFVLLGTQVNFALVSKHLWVGLLLVLIFMVIARPIAVFASVLVDKRAKWSKKHVAFMCWVRETGVIPAALSGVLIAKKVPGAELISAITFMAILLTIVIQASSTGFVAKRLQVLRDADIEDV